MQHVHIVPAYLPDNPVCMASLQHRNPVELLTYYLLVNLKQQQKLLVNIMQHLHPVEIYFQRIATMRVGLRKLDAVAYIELMCCFKVFLDLP